MSSSTPTQQSPAADKEALRKFYFSHSTDFTRFKKVNDTREKKSQQLDTLTAEALSGGSPAAAGGAAAAQLSLSAVSVGGMSSIGRASPEGPPTQTAVPSIAASPAEGGAASGGAPAPIATVGISSLRTLSESGAGRLVTKAGKPTKASSSGSASSPLVGGAPPAAASAEYLQFLRRQQELNYQHGHLITGYDTMQEQRKASQSSIVKMRREAMELLRTIEESTDWNLRSKYDIQQLIRDCSLSLQPVELVEEKEPNYEGITLLAQNLTKIQKSFGATEQMKAHALFVEQALRRVGALQKALAEGNMDSSELARIPDTLVVHLETVLKLPTIERLIESAEENVAKLAFDVETARTQRDQAVEDGEVHIAERLCYDIVDAHEAILNHVLAKKDVLQSAIKENIVLETVRAQYQHKTVDEFEQVRIRARKLRGRCEEDVKKMFALREKVEEVEAQTVKKVQVDREISDRVLQENHKKLEIVFAKMDELVKEVEVLERERHREVQKRVVEKDRDEHRRAEFAQFCGVVDAHVIPLERTIKNMDIVAHSVDCVQELVVSGFKSLEEDLRDRLALLRDIKLETHKQHVEVFRGLLLEIGDVTYKKERMIEETDKSIQQAHVQQEILAETFNPNAKKFGDVKKRLLASRDDLEADVADLKDRVSKALTAFEVTEAALSEAGVEFVHPVAEQQHRMLEQRARMMEVKAAAVGHVEGQPIMAEISELRETLLASRGEMQAVNASTSGTINKALPMIRAATKARGK